MILQILQIYKWFYKLSFTKYSWSVFVKMAVFFSKIKANFSIAILFRSIQILLITSLKGRLHLWNKGPIRAEFPEDFKKQH